MAHEAFLGQGEAAYQAWEGNWEKVQSVDVNSFQGLADINRLTTDIFFAEDVFAHHHVILGESAESRQAVVSAVGIHNFPAQETVTKEQYTALLQAGHEKEQLARSYILRHIKEGATFGLNPWEVDVLGTSCRMAGEFDMMCSRWREEVQHNPLNDQAKPLNLNNQYTVIRQGETGPDEVSFAKAFSEQVDVIVAEFNQLADRLKTGEPEAEQLAMADYLQTFAGALGSNDLPNLADMWRGVDKVWLNVKGRLQPIASREYDYYDKNAIRIFPDFRLAYINQESKLFQSVEATRAAMIKHLGKQFSGIDAYDDTAPAMSQVQVFPEGYDVVYAGSLDFQPAGQSLPNEDEIKRNFGVKLFLNPDTINDRWNLALGLAQKALPKDAHLFDMVSVAIDGVSIHVGGHEIGEPLLDTDPIRDAVTGQVFRLLNEDAATLATTVIMPDRVREKELPEQFLLTQALQLLGVYLRYIDMARGAPHLEPYYKGMGLLGLKRMADSGFIHFVGDELQVDLEAADSLYELSMRDFTEQVAIADSKDKEKALAYLAPIETAESIPEIAYLIKALHPND